MRKRARIGARCAALTLLPLAALAAAAPAHADARGLYNGFEESDIGKWDRLAGGDGRAGFEIGTGTALTGQGNGRLSATQGWAREGTWASFDRPFRHCTARVYVRPDQDLQFELRVWTPQGKQLISTAPWLTAGDYRLVQVDWTAEGDNNNFVEAVIGANGTPRAVRLDALTVVCSDGNRT
ncbi:hypothetical protein ACFVHW_06765 [Streptomyces sp. NPDC127110]|uniref:hypothetical protein n=1 Tax=Streptomyces sp. NPDC127110 TaxID=3345362 RepID=UPI00362F4F1C